MKANQRSLVGTSIALALLALTALPASAAPPFGLFGGKAGGGNAGDGVIPLQGWALDDNGLEGVDIVVDGIVVGRANYGRARPLVATTYPGYPDSNAAGFAYQLDTTHFLNGSHTVSARVRSKTGEVTNLNSKVFQFVNTTHNLAPFGSIEFPQPNAELFGVCTPSDPVRRYSVVTGYALDAGVQADDSGVGYVELLLDRALLYNSRTSCFFSPVTGGLSNCYGLRRLDIEKFFPSLVDGPHSGFRFVLDVGQLLNIGYTRGKHTLTIRSGDLFGTVRNIAEIPVTFTCDEDLENDGSFGGIDLPLQGLLYTGTVTAFGWALDFQGVATVSIIIDGHLEGYATLGFPRPGISALYPGYPDTATPGWRFVLDTTKQSNGEHFLQVLVTDDLGFDTLIGERRFRIANPGH